MEGSIRTSGTHKLSSQSIPLDHEDAVHRRYTAGAQQREPSLCCPIDYDAKLLDAIPQEIIERDYGCGDPTRYVRPRDVVVDLGCGGGKLCYVAAQVAGRDGRVIGVDSNAAMLDLARRHTDTVAETLGFANVEFRCGLIQDLALDLDLLTESLKQRPIRDQESWLELRAVEQSLRSERPMIADASVDCVISNCVLNLVRPQDRQQLFGEIFRVLKPGGRTAISDIVADEDVPERLQHDAELWSGCISGAFREDRFLQTFENAGFHGIQIDRLQQRPWKTLEGIEFRSITVLAYKGKQGPCWDHKQALIYRGPFKSVHDDDGHIFHRGERTAVCEKTCKLLQGEPYLGLFEPVEPREPVVDPTPFDCRRVRQRAPSETKGLGYRETIQHSSQNCECDSSCC